MFTYIDEVDEDRKAFAGHFAAGELRDQVVIGPIASLSVEASLMRFRPVPGSFFAWSVGGAEPGWDNGSQV